MAEAKTPAKKAAAKKAPAKKTAAKKAAVTEVKAPAPTTKAKDREVPVPVDQPAVEVSPSAAPTVSFHGKEYEVTPEGGHRLKS